MGVCLWRRCGVCSGQLLQLAACRQRPGNLSVARESALRNHSREARDFLLGICPEPPRLDELAAFYVNVLLVGAAVWLVMLWVHRARPGVVLKAVGIVFMLLALLALKSAAHLSILPEGTTTERLLTRAGVATLLIFAFLRFERLVRYTLTTILLILSPLVPVDVILATRNILFSTPETHASAPFNLHAAVPARVLILVFDEMDQRLTFVTRPTG